MKNVFMDYIKNQPNISALKVYGKMVEQINEINFGELTEVQLLEKSQIYKQKVLEGASLDIILIEAFALVKEAVRRTLGLEAFDEQLIAGIAMHDSRLVEMQTGEGKTLAAVFPAYLNALSGKGVHILTFNDYLAGRDAGWMGPVYRMLGLSVGCVQQGMSKAERKNAYHCDITYVTGKEAGFDYLRDFMSYRKEDLVHRSFNFAIVDEADSILIDEARIPLVIAASKKEEASQLYVAADTVRKLKPDIDYLTDEYSRNVYFNEEGVMKIEAMLGCGNLCAQENFILLTELNNALHAEVLLQRDVDYIVKNGKIEMIDEFTGRVAENRHWPDALQAALETKEGLKLQSGGRIMSQITMQAYLLMYKKLSGMTGTAVDSSEEIKDFYCLDVVVIPQHKPCIRKDMPDFVFTHKEAKFKALIDEIARVHATGQPVLIGTSSVKESSYLAHELEKSGVSCNVLNAKNDEFEAGIIEQAGALGSVTVSTNMAGRGTDIKLGGSNEADREKVVKLGGLYVIGTNRHESRRIDKQLRGRAGRQGDPGITRFFISLEDNLLVKYGIDRIIPAEIRPKNQDAALDNPKILKKINQVQRIVEGQNSDLRRELWKYAIILENQRMVIHERRTEILLEDSPLEGIFLRHPDLYDLLKEKWDKATFEEFVKLSALYHIDDGWADHLLHAALYKEGIHLNLIGGKNPLEVYRIDMAKAFDDLEIDIESAIVQDFSNVAEDPDVMEEIKEKLKPPSSTWTYLVNDNTLEQNLAMFIFGLAGGKGAAAMAAVIVAPLMAVAPQVEKLLKKIKKRLLLRKL